eukprot:NODE_33_length_36935_cov_1.609241.p7 type:complete len:423 gc:universal NODE_33_length_36935_cov_1.609241:9917-8649(-)
MNMVILINLVIRRLSFYLAIHGENPKDELEALIKENPENFMARFYLAYWANKHEPDSSAILFSELNKIDRSSVLVILYMGNCFLNILESKQNKLGKVNENEIKKMCENALKWFKVAFQLSPKNPYVANAFIILLHKLGKNHEALQQLNILRASHPQIIMIQTNYAHLLMQEARYTEAVQEYLIALAHLEIADNTFGKLLFYISRAYFKSSLITSNESELSSALLYSQRCAFQNPSHLRNFIDFYKLLSETSQFFLKNAAFVSDEKIKLAEIGLKSIKLAIEDKHFRQLLDVSSVVGKLFDYENDVKNLRNLHEHFLKSEKTRATMPDMTEVKEMTFEKVEDQEELSEERVQLLEKMKEMLYTEESRKRTNSEDDKIKKKAKSGKRKKRNDLEKQPEQPDNIAADKEIYKRPSKGLTIDSDNE